MATRLIRASAEGPAALDIAASHALLLRAAAGELAATTRLYRPCPTLAFGRTDVRCGGFEAAAAAARRHGFEPVVRLAGGEAAAYHPAALVFEQVIPAPRALAGMHGRYASLSALLCEALQSIGADAAVEELPGEYCPGAYSVRVGDTKVAGIAQRVVQGASLTTAFVIVARGAEVREVLVDACAALGRPWDPATAGALADHHPQITVAAVERAIVAACHRRDTLVDATLDDDTTRLARQLHDRHRVAATRDRLAAPDAALAHTRRP